jgi:hypothetical protein
MTHIFIKRTAALDLLRRGLITKAEAAKLSDQSEPAIAYQSRGIDAKAARSTHIQQLWLKEIETHGTASN